MRLLIKLGGTLVDDAGTLAGLAAELAATSQEHEVVVVHGGGKQMTAYLAERGVVSQFVGGLRVTGPEVVDALLKVFAGSVNHGLVAALVAAGATAVGLTGIDATLVECERLSEELGQVGKPVRANAKLLETLIGGGFLPVVACVGGDRHGSIYNVNADQMAVACATGWRAERLLFLTDVAGVRDGSGMTAPQLDVAHMRLLIQDGVATGGMQAKLNAAMEALEGGVGSVLIAPGAEAQVIGKVLAGERIGTRLVA